MILALHFAAISVFSFMRDTYKSSFGHFWRKHWNIWKIKMIFLPVLGKKKELKSELKMSWKFQLMPENMS